MPQFDSYSFSGQIFWTLLGFFIFYFFVLNFYVVHLSEVVKMRQKLYISSLQNKKISTVDIYNPFLRSIF
jgi:Plant ATP synthase F0